MTIQFAEEPLAKYGVTHQRDHRHFRQVTPKRIFDVRAATAAKKVGGWGKVPP